MTAPPVADKDKKTEPAPSGSPPPAPSPSPSPSPTGPTSPFAGLAPEEKDRMLAQQAQVIRDNARKQAETDAKIKAMEDRLNAPPPVDLKTQTKAFFDDPVSVIRKELNDTVKPLIEFKDQFGKQAEYERLKGQFKKDARYKGFFEMAGVEDNVDSLMSTLPATPQALYSVIVGLRGGMEFGDIPKPGGQPPAGGAPRPQDTTVPPHLRPTPPPLPEPEKKEDASVKARIDALDENARRLIREWNMTPESYIQWVDEEAVKVAASQIGVKKPEGAAK